MASKKIMVAVLVLRIIGSGTRIALDAYAQAHIIHPPLAGTISTVPQNKNEDLTTWANGGDHVDWKFRVAFNQRLDKLVKSSSCFVVGEELLLSDHAPFGGTELMDAKTVNNS